MSLGLPLLACAVASCTEASPNRTAAATPDSVAFSAARAAPVPVPAEKVATRAPRPSGPLNCGVKGSSTIGETGIADLQMGRTISAIKQSCLVTRDAVGPWVEGATQRVLTVLVGGANVYAAVDGGIISSIAVKTPRFATADGLRVGTQLSHFASEKRVKMTEGEQGLYLRVPSHCGLAFHFSIQSRAKPGMAWPPPRLVELHGRAMVDQIIISRCVQ